MERPKRSSSDEPSDLNLAPMMNLVIILIPMLLLSVVFLEIGVINVATPTLVVGIGSDLEPSIPGLDLRVAISATGFRVAAAGVVLPAGANCPESGPTICLADQSVDLEAKVAQAKRLMEANDTAAGSLLLDEALAAYDFAALYNEFMRLKAEFPSETVITLSADADIPYAVVVRVMDVARFQREQASYAAANDFWQAEARAEGNAYALLFSDPVLSLY
ncbi:MAG: biopolymer transporter ExbD [Bradymonadaceae bacterium]|nr:biopolymer transporter ExbD [Lujinxingiaceae bacterium]